MSRVLLLSLLALTALAQTPDLVQDKQTPGVIVPGVTTTLTAEFRLVGTITSVTINPVWAPTTEVPLTSPSKGVWTINLPVDQILANTAIADIYRPFVGFVNAYNGATRVFRYNFFTQVAPPDIARVPVTNVAPDLQYTSYVANIVLPAALPDPFGANPTDVAGLQNLITRRFYQAFGDDYDVLNIVYVPAVRNNRFHYSTRNNIQGIGESILNNDASFGSAGRLIGISTFPIPTLFDGGERGFSHEFTHTFVDYLSFAPFKAGNPHWPYSTMANGIMGISIAGSNVGGDYNCLLTPNGPNLIASSTSQPPKAFNDFDLYLMGLLPPNQVSDQYVVTDTALATSCSGVIPAGSFQRVSVNDIIAGAGARVAPVPATSPTNYHLGVIVVSQTLLSADEMALYTFFARRSEEQVQLPVHGGLITETDNPFYLATGKRATFNTQLQPVTWPSISPGGVVNGASFTPRVSPGSFTSIYGTFLLLVPASTPSAALPSTLAGVTVLINGLTAPLYYVSGSQINFQVPFEIKPGLASVTVLTPQGPSNTAWINVTPAGPGIILYGNNRAVATNQDNSLNGPDSPAAPGSVITVYLTGIGQVSGTQVTGQPAPASPLPRSTLPYSATIGNKPAVIQYVGLTPGFAGLAQANIIVPAGLPPGDAALQLTIGAVSSNAPLIAISQ